MENVSKALLIAAAILITIMLVTVGIKIFNSSKGVTEQAQQVGNSIFISTQNAIKGIQITGEGNDSETKTVPEINLRADPISDNQSIYSYVELSNVSESNYPICIEYYINGESRKSNKIESGTTDYYYYSGLQEYTSYNIEVKVIDNLGNVVTASTTQGTQCFLADTQVLTAEGMKNIEDIKLGEKVYSINLDNNQRELKKVTKLYKGTTNETFEITVGKEIIKTTPRHQFYIVDKGWIRAYELEVGDKVVCKNSNDMEITNIEYKYHEESVPVFNLTIEGNHNYLITKYELLVHNAASVK